tara:strand:+ start:7745 stop:8095 length:351 start_codon:yes stop_codon:yes gene_type:complete
MKYILSLFLLILAISSQAEIVSSDLIGKAADIHLTSNYQESTGTGNIEVKLCSSCILHKLIITPQTKVINGSTAIDRSQLKMYMNSNRQDPMRLQFHKHTKQIFYINLQFTEEYPQ